MDNNHNNKNQMKDEVNTEELKEAAREEYRRMKDELERKQEEAEELKIRMRVVEATEGLLDEIDRLRSENEAQREDTLSTGSNEPT